MALQDISIKITLYGPVPFFHPQLLPRTGSNYSLPWSVPLNRAERSKEGDLVLLANET